MITDAEKRMVCMLVGMPQDEGWFGVLKDIMDAMDAAEREFRWTAAETLPDYSRGEGTNRRGEYKTVAGGVSFGTGQKVRSLTTYCTFLTACSKRFLASSSIQPTTRRY